MNRFKELRKELHLTQAELIKQYNQRFNRTYSIPALSLFENGHRLPELPALENFAEFFNCSVDYLIGRTDIRHHSKNQPAQPAPSYYHDPEVAQMASEIKDNPDMRILFDASRDLKKESIEEVVKFIEFQKAKERGDWD
jgi:transcriptional regulator with XRE-family HTH domain